MKFIRDVGAATAPESSPSEKVDKGGSTSAVEKAHGAVHFFSRSSEDSGEQTVVSVQGELGVTCIIVVAPSSTIPDDKIQQPIPTDSASSSTSEPGRAEDLYRTVLNLFATARHVDFEDGVHTDFSRKLLHLIEMLGNSAVEVIASIIIGEKANPSVSAEALKWIGHIDQPRSYAFRLWLLERSLQSSFAIIRDAALLGVASADDPHSIPPIRNAISREACLELREDLTQVLMQLDRQCHLYSER
jgi:hypothetical protein